MEFADAGDSLKPAHRLRESGGCIEKSNEGKHLAQGSVRDTRVPQRRGLRPVGEAGSDDAAGGVMALTWRRKIIVRVNLNGGSAHGGNSRRTQSHAFFNS